MVAAQAGRAASAAPLDGNRRRRVANRNRQDGPTRQRERLGGRTHRNGTGSPVAAALRVPHERRRPGATPRTLGIQPPPQPSPTPAGEGDRGMGVGGQLLGPPEALRAARGRGVPPRPPRRRRPLLLGRLPQHRHPGALAWGEEAEKSSARREPEQSDTWGYGLTIRYHRGVFSKYSKRRLLMRWGDLSAK